MKATGGGAFKFANLFKEKLGVTLDKVDEMDCLVAGANFLLKVGLLSWSVFLFFVCFPIPPLELKHPSLMLFSSKIPTLDSRF